MFKTVRSKLLGAFVAVIIALSAVVGVVLLSMSNAAQRVGALADGTMADVERLGRFESTALQRAVLVRDLALTEDVETQAALMAATLALEERSSAMLAEIVERARGGADESAMADVAAKAAEVDAALSEAKVAIDEGRFYDLGPMIAEQIRPRQRSLLETVRSLVDERMNETSTVSRTIASESDRLMLVLLGVLVATALGAIGIALWVSARIVGALGMEPVEASAIMRAIATGDLTKTIHTAGARPESLLVAIRDMQESLLGVVGGVRRSAQSVAAASEEIAEANASLSQRTEEEASTLEQSVSALQQLVERVQASAQDAVRANELASTANDVVVNGGEVVSEVVATMREIHESSAKVSAIISVIDGIAFQTNILALNAAVEAARAGEQGRGFAVVASEVRNLAQRSSKAAAEISDLISSSVQRIDHGSELVDKAGDAMREVVDVTSSVTGIMTSISRASEDQLQTLNEINNAFSNMDTVVQQNAAMVEESAASARSLKSQADELVTAVDVFKVS